MKISPLEMRILRFLKVADFKLKYATYMAPKLDVTYDHMRKILRNMTLKGWLIQHQHDKKVFYRIADKAPRVWTQGFTKGVSRNDRS